MRASVCVGNYTTTSYYVAELGLSVYCIEELCYVMKENAFLLDTSIMNDVLVEWVGESCGLKELSRELYSMVHKKGSLSGFVTIIMEYVGLYDNDTIREVEQVLKRGAGLSNIEKRKSQIDYLVRKKKYMAAARGYEYLLTTWEEAANENKELPGMEVKASILHNMGVALTGMMSYNHGAKYFRQAYELMGNEESLTAFLATRRLALSEEDYVAFMAEHPQFYKASMDLEKQLEKLQNQWESHADYLRLDERRQWRYGADKQKYYEESDQIVEALKSAYRHRVTE